MATLRVLGYTRAEIPGMLLGELALLTIAALPLGMAIGYGLSAFTASSFDFDVYRIPLVVNRRTYALAATVTLIASAISGLVVRRRIDRLDLVTVLESRE